MTVKITRPELTASDMRREAGRTKDADAARRMLAIALLLEGLQSRAGGASVGYGSPDAAGLGSPLQS